MAKAVRFDVRCTICKSISKRSCWNTYQIQTQRSIRVRSHSTTTVILEEGHGLVRTMESFFSPNAEDVLTSKRRRIEVTESSETSTKLGLSQLDTSLIRDSDSQMIISNEEMVEYDASHECSIAEISEESDPADPENTLHSEDYVANHSLTSGLGIQCIGSLKDISMSKDSHPVQPRNIKFPWLASSIERLLHHSMIDTLG